MNMGLIVRSKIREIVELSVSDEVELELEKKVEEMLKKAEERAKANQRRTIFARDL
jgi:histone H3/H4